MEKHKYLSNFDYFSLQSNALFGSLDYDCTHMHMPMYIDLILNHNRSLNLIMIFVVVYSLEFEPFGLHCDYHYVCTSKFKSWIFGSDCDCDYIFVFQSMKLKPLVLIVIGFKCVPTNVGWFIIFFKMINSYFYKSLRKLA
jgi:hypothetical protein